ncbi:patatin-like protein [Thermaurantiacus tibetensis]|uniref:patatin-like protein n=1 Tax=Thermaurantiacus tibetensis TaxID=2759035 RepID=UPI00189074D7|nr:patatin-like protein [Thermaurantiacus tibetensis]
MREKELRLALVCYGGISLVIYMHGVTRELWKLLRASEARQAGRSLAAGDSEPVWRALLDALGTAVDLRVVVDVIAGASAGGINGILLGAAIVQGLDLDPVTDMWLDGADIDRLLDPDARPGSRFVAFYKEPVAWYARKRSETLATLRSDRTGREVAEKLGRFVRSRWFKPPFSGPRVVAMLDEAFAAMETGSRGPALLPATLGFDLFVTVTDYFGTRTAIPIHSPPVVEETEHRRILAFRAPPVAGAAPRVGPEGGAPPRQLASRLSLVFAARATSSFPGAFPAASLAEVDARAAETGADWPDRAWLAETQLKGDRPAEEVLLIDGSVLDNAPFGPAIEAIRAKPAYREVDRRFVYIDPKPGVDLLGGGLGRNRPPGFLTAMLRALAQIPREQPIRDNLETIARMSAAAARTRAVIDDMTPDVEAAVARAVGPRFLLLPLTPARLARARGHVARLAAREAGYAHAAYRGLRRTLVLADAAALLATAAPGAAAPGDLADRLARGGTLVDPDRLDLGYRVRKLRFLVRRLNAHIEAAHDETSRRALEALKAAAYAADATYAAPAAAARLSDGTRAAARALLAGDFAAAAPALEGLAADLALEALDRAADSALLQALAAPGLPGPVRRAVVRDWLGYPFYDSVLLPLLGDGNPDSLDAIKVDRISPDDMALLSARGVAPELMGWRLNAFGAFFSRAWRENDYLWGRLNAAERLVDILLSAVPGDHPARAAADGWKARLFRAIVAAERARLGSAGPLLDRIEGGLDAWEEGR